MPTGKERPDIGKLINDAVQAAMGQERERNDRARKQKEDPAGWIEDTIRRVVREEIDGSRQRDIDAEDEVRREGRRRTSRAGDDEDDEGGDAGLFQLFVGGGKGS